MGTITLFFNSRSCDRGRDPGSGTIPGDNNTSLPEKAAHFAQAEFPMLCGMRIESVTREEVRVSLPINGTRNGNGVVHGGAIFAVADQAFGIASNLQGKEVAVMAEMRFLTPATGDITAIARCVGQDEKFSCYNVEVWQGNRLVALFTGTGIKLGKSEKR